MVPLSISTAAYSNSIAASSLFCVQASPVSSAHVAKDVDTVARD